MDKETGSQRAEKRSEDGDGQLEGGVEHTISQRPLGSPPASDSPSQPTCSDLAKSSTRRPLALESNVSPLSQLAVVLALLCRRASNCLSQSNQCGIRLGHSLVRPPGPIPLFE